MNGRVVLVILVVVTLVSALIAIRLPHPVSAQDLLPTPVGQLGGRMPLPTAEGLPGGSLLQNTPVPTGHPLLGEWLLAFAEPGQAPAQAVFEADGLVTFIDAAGNRGAGVWIPDGRQSGVMAVVVREVDEAGQASQITILQGSIDVERQGAAATLVYSIETVKGSGTAPERTGPFTASGQRVDQPLGVPTPE